MQKLIKKEGNRDNIDVVRQNYFTTTAASKIDVDSTLFFIGFPVLGSIHLGHF